MILCRRLAKCFIVCAFATIFPFGSAQIATAAGEPTLELGPSEIAIGPGEQADVLVVVRNTGDTPVTVDTFKAGPVAGLTVNLPDPAALGTIMAGSAASTELSIVSDAGFLGGSLSIQAVGRAGELPFVASAELTIAARDPDPALTVALVGVPDTLSDGETQSVLIQVANPSAHVWSNVTLQATGSESLCWVQKSDAACPTDTAPLKLTLAGSIQSGGLIETTLIVRAHDRVRAGTQTVSVVATASRESTPLTESAGSAQANIKVTIFGVDLLSPFGITSLFLIPGAFALLAFQFARGLFVRHAGAATGLDLKDPGALLFIIPVSVLVYLIALVWLNRDLRNEAGTFDVLSLFLAGLLIGFVTALAWWLRWWWIIGRKTFTIKDSPTKVLARLALRSTSLVRPTIDVSGRHLFLLVESEQRVVACQRITYQFGMTDLADRRVFTRAVEDSDLQTVRARVKDKGVILQWADKDQTGIIDVPENTVTRAEPASPLLTEIPIDAPADEALE